MSFDITPGDGIAGELALLGDLIVGGFPEAVFTLPGVNVDEVLDHARLYLGFAADAETAQTRIRSLELPEFVGVEGEFFRGRVPGELAMQLGAAVESYSRVGSGIKELARELDASQVALKPLEARARAVFEHMQRVWIKVNVPFTEYSGLRSEWDQLVRAAGVVHERVVAAGQRAAAEINAGTEAMIPVNEYFSTLPGGAVTGGVVARGVRSTAARAVAAGRGVTGAPGRAVKAGVDGLGAAAGAVTSVPQQVNARGQQLAAQVTAYGARVEDQIISDPRSQAAQRLVREGRATNILGVDASGVPTAMLMLASPNTLLREQQTNKKRNAGRRWTTDTAAARTGSDQAVAAAQRTVAEQRDATQRALQAVVAPAGQVAGSAGQVREGAVALARDVDGVWVVGGQLAQAAQKTAQLAGNIEGLATMAAKATAALGSANPVAAIAQTAQAGAGQLISVPGRFIGGFASVFTDGISGTAALVGVGGDPVRAWTGLGWNILNPAKGVSRFAVSATPLDAAADPVRAAGGAAYWGSYAAVAAIPFGWIVTLPALFTIGTLQTLLRPGQLSRLEAINTLTQSLDNTTARNLQYTAQRAAANTSEVQVTTGDVDVHADRGGYVTFTLPDLEGGEPKAWYILATPDSPGNFTTNVPTQPGEELVERGDGSVVLVNTRTGETVRTVKTPWAKDALGRDQQTWYTIDKVDDQMSTITQHIAPLKGAMYPLIADAPSGGALVKPPTDAKIAGISGGAIVGGSANAGVGQAVSGSVPSTSSSGSGGSGSPGNGRPGLSLAINPPATTAAPAAPVQQPAESGDRDMTGAGGISEQERQRQIERLRAAGVGLPLGILAGTPEAPNTTTGNGSDSGSSAGSSGSGSAFQQSVVTNLTPPGTPIPPVPQAPAAPSGERAESTGADAGAGLDPQALAQARERLAAAGGTLPLGILAGTPTTPASPESAAPDRAWQQMVLTNLTPPGQPIPPVPTKSYDNSGLAQAEIDHEQSAAHSVPPEQIAAQAWTGNFGTNAAKLQDYFLDGVHPVSQTTGVDNGVQYALVTMSDGSLLTIRGTPGQDPFTDRFAKFQVKNSPLLGNADLDPKTGKVSPTRGAGETLLQGLDTASWALVFVPGGQGFGAGSKVLSVAGHAIISTGEKKIVEGATAAVVKHEAQEAARAAATRELAAQQAAAQRAAATAARPAGSSGGGGGTGVLAAPPRPPITGAPGTGGGAAGSGAAGSGAGAVGTGRQAIAGGVLAGSVPIAGAAAIAGVSEHPNTDEQPETDNPKTPDDKPTIGAPAAPGSPTTPQPTITPGGTPAGHPPGLPDTTPDTTPGGTPTGDPAGSPTVDPTQTPGGLPGGTPAATPPAPGEQPPTEDTPNHPDTDPDTGKDKGTGVPVQPIPAPTTNPNTIPNTGDPAHPGEPIRIPGQPTPGPCPLILDTG